MHASISYVGPQSGGLTASEAQAQTLGECNAPTPRVDDTPFHGLLDAQQHVDGLCGRIMALAEKLVGPIPQEGKAGEAQRVYSGFFGGVEEAADRVRERVREAHVALDRISRSLP